MRTVYSPLMCDGRTMRLEVSRICAPGLRRSVSPFTCTKPAGEICIFAFTASSGIGRGRAAIARDDASPRMLATRTERECGRKDEPDRSGTVGNRGRMIPDRPAHVNAKAL